MDVIEKKIQALKDFQASIPETINRVSKDKASILVKYNTNAQLYTEGVNAEGVKISSYRPYRPLTISIKKSKGQPTDRVTLKDTGDFHSSIKVELTPDGILFTATDRKTLELMAKYGDSILGLTDENLNAFSWGEIFPELLKQLKEV